MSNEKESTIRAKEYLERLGTMNMVVDSKLEDIRKLRLLTTQISSQLSGMPKSSSKNAHTLEGTIAKLVDLEEEVNEEIDALIDLREETKNMILLLKDEKCRLLLLYKYVYFLSWDELARKIHYTKRTLYRIHSEGLKRFALILDTYVIKT